MKISVIIPVGPGHEDASHEAIASVRAAWNRDPGPFTELLIKNVDDTKGNLGRSAARNRAVREASDVGCDWIFFLDADDLMHVEAFGSFGARYRDQDALFGLIVEARKEDDEASLRVPQVPALKCLNDYLAHDPAQTCQMGHFVKTAVARRLPFNERADCGEDVAYYLALWSRYRCEKVPAIFMINRRGNHSTGPRSATGGQWRAAVDILMSEARSIAGYNTASSGHIRRLNAYAESLGELLRATGHTNLRECLGELVSACPWRGYADIPAPGRSFVMYSDNDCHVVANVLWAGLYAPVESAVWTNICGRGEPGVLVDVHSGHGYWALLAARASRDCRIMALESREGAIMRLRQNAKINGVKLELGSARESAIWNSPDDIRAVRAPANFIEHSSALVALLEREVPILLAPGENGSGAIDEAVAKAGARVWLIDEDAMSVSHLPVLQRRQPGQAAIITHLDPSEFLQT